jgi:hypothetical protein
MAPIPDPVLPFMLRNYPGITNQPWFDLNTYGGNSIMSSVFVNSNERHRYNGAGRAYLAVPGSAS